MGSFQGSLATYKTETYNAPFAGFEFVKHTLADKDPARPDENPEEVFWVCAGKILTNRGPVDVSFRIPRFTELSEILANFHGIYETAVTQLNEEMVRRSLLPNATGSSLITR